VRQVFTEHDLQVGILLESVEVQQALARLAIAIGVIFLHVSHELRFVLLHPGQEDAALLLLAVGSSRLRRLAESHRPNILHEDLTE